MFHFFDIPGHIQGDGGEEFFETLLSGSKGMRLERIISHGHTTPEGVWYDQAQDEWVMVAEGEACLEYEDGCLARLSRGDCVFLPAHCRHRVAYTSSPCIWLAVHGEALKYELLARGRCPPAPYGKSMMPSP